MPRKHGSKVGNSFGGRMPWKTRKARKRLGSRKRSREARAGLNNDGR